MFHTTFPTRNSSRVDLPNNPGQRHRANFARQATIDAFGYRHGKALDQAGFIDRLPGDLPMSSPDARFR